MRRASSAARTRAASPPGTRNHAAGERQRQAGRVKRSEGVVPTVALDLDRGRVADDLVDRATGDHARPPAITTSLSHCSASSM